MSFSFDDIFGCTFYEYCALMGTTPAKVVESKRIKISLLERSYQNCIDHRDDDPRWVELARYISGLIHEERKKLKRLEKLNNG